jgi:hypothetical protein
VADEYGALTSSTSGQTTTVSGSLDQLFTAIEGLQKEYFIYRMFCEDDPRGWMYKQWIGELSGESVVKHISRFKPTFHHYRDSHRYCNRDISAGNGHTRVLHLAAKPTKQQLLRALTKSGDSFLSAARQELVNIQKAAGEDRGGAWLTWIEAAVPVLSSPQARVDADLLAEARKLIAVLVASGTSEHDLIQATLDYSGSVASVADAERTLYNQVAWEKPILTFEYDCNTPSNQPTNSAFGLIWGQSLKRWKMTGNAAGSIYNPTPSISIPGSGRLRDIRVAIEADHNPYQLSNSLTTAFSAAYYFQDQTSPAILNVTPSSPIPGASFTGLSSSATQVFTQKGTIHRAIKDHAGGQIQFRMEDSIAITGSNCSELITKPTIGAQVGISYDFDSLFSLSK